MKTLSVCVPSKSPCINGCKFCVSRMRRDEYPVTIEKLPSETEERIRFNRIEKRLRYAKDVGCNTMMLTGQVEPQSEWDFLSELLHMNKTLGLFHRVEMQTSGTLLSLVALKQLEAWGVSTIALSIASFDDKINNDYIGRHAEPDFSIERFCNDVRKAALNLRICLNLTDNIGIPHDKILTRVKELKARQLTLRKLYTSGNNTPQDRWIAEHGVTTEKYNKIREIIESEGVDYRGNTDIGQTNCYISDVSVAFDTDCMAQDELKDRYYILRQDGRLYSHWDTPASLIF